MAKAAKLTDSELDRRWFAWCLNEWRGMPEYVCKALEPTYSLMVTFRSFDDVRAFAELIGQPQITEKTRAILFPPDPIVEATNTMRWISKEDA